MDPLAKPIAALHLSEPTHASAGNVVGWLFDLYPGDTFAARVNAYIAQSIGVMTEMGAGSGCVWDLEAHASPAYVGSPDLAMSLNKDFGPLIPNFFKQYRLAGFEMGSTITAGEYDSATNTLVTSRDPLATMLRKCVYARQHWLCKLFYFDVNFYTPQGGELLPADFFGWMSRVLPDCYFVPEAETLDYYKQPRVRPYLALENGETGAPAEARKFGGRAVIECNAGDIDGNRDKLIESVRAGDTLLTNGWSMHERVSKVAEIYRAARSN